MHRDIKMTPVCEKLLHGFRESLPTGQTALNLQVGAERDLGSNLLAVAKANIYSSQTAQTGATATNDIIRGGSLGLVYLFN